MGEPVTVEQFPGGHSNLTYLVMGADREWVLRRAPIGTIAPKAHDMAREFRILAAIHPHFPEAPQVYRLCEDPAIIGATFFLMERRRGHILRDRIPADLSATPQQISELFIDCLARLHSIPLVSNGLDKLGKPEGFVERQVKGWAERWRRAQTAEVPLMDQVIHWLETHLPESADASIVHNDFKLDNVMVAPAKIAAVLDWEMTTIGDPLADLGLTLSYWCWVNRPNVRTAGVPALTLEPGWYTREQFLDRYAARTGRDLRNIAYFEVLGVFKLAVIVQQIYLRFHLGQTADPRFRDFGERAAALVALAAGLAEAHA
ncbi:MAG: phosphotransferase family protein [Acidobacteria bacterium]|nr:phosphotransferase family protein [Acidobacteriota bacterium]